VNPPTSKLPFDVRVSGGSGRKLLELLGRKSENRQNGVAQVGETGG
jgi:hypothetical protein